jgi:hypothetical protein
MQCFWVTGQCPATADQGCHPLPERTIQPFNVGRVDQASTLTTVQQMLHLFCGPLHNTPPYTDHTPLSVLFDHLGDIDIRPGDQAWPPNLAGVQWGAESLLKSVNICTQAIHTQQQGPTQGTGTHLLSQGSHQVLVTMSIDDSSQPQPGTDHYGRGHPHYPALHFDPNLIGLHVPQITGLAWYEMGMHFLAVLPGSPLPFFDRPLINPKGGHNGLDRTAISQQSNDQAHCVNAGTQPIEGCAFRGGEGFVTGSTLEAPFLLTMDGDIALSNLSP